MKAISAVATAFVLLVASSLAQAVAVTWVLEDVSFSDGTTVTGFFTLDSDAIGVLGDFSLVTESGLRSGFVYTPDSVTFSQVNMNGVIVATPDDVLQLWITGSLFDQNALPTVPAPSLVLNGAATIPSSSEHDFGSAGNIRYVAGGSIVAVPEPSRFAMLVAGIGLLLLGYRRFSWTPADRLRG